MQSSKFELVISAQTARMLGLTVPDKLLAVAVEGDCVAKLFSQPNWAILIQGEAQALKIQNRVQPDSIIALLRRSEE